MKRTFTVPIAPDVAWELLRDPSRLIDCIPEATPQEHNGEVVEGKLVVHFGNRQVSYRGTGAVTAASPADRSVDLAVDAEQMRGKGQVTLRLKVALTAEGEGTAVAVSGKVKATGKATDFLAATRSEAVEQFIEALTANLIAAAPGVKVTTPAPETEEVSATSAQEMSALDAVAAATAAEYDTVKLVDNDPVSTPAPDPGVGKAVVKDAVKDTPAPAPAATWESPAKAQTGSQVPAGAFAAVVLALFIWLLRRRQARRE